MPYQFDVLNWLNKHFNNVPDFNRDEINSVTDFSLMWNLLENELGNNQMSIDQLGVIARTIAVKPNCNDFYQPYLTYFQNRYITQNNTNNIFENLLFRRNDKKEFVADVLKGNLTNPQEIIEAILIIIYRFRNNLFHGEKELHNIHTQYNNFNMANKFLAHILTINKTP